MPGPVSDSYDPVWGTFAGLRDLNKNATRRLAVLLWRLEKLGLYAIGRVGQESLLMRLEDACVSGGRQNRH